MHVKALHSGVTQKMELESPALSRDLVLVAFASCPCIFPPGEGWLDGKLSFLPAVLDNASCPQNLSFQIKCSWKSFGCKKGLSCLPGSWCGDSSTAAAGAILSLSRQDGMMEQRVTNLLVVTVQGWALLRSDKCQIPLPKLRCKCDHIWKSLIWILF